MAAFLRAFLLCTECGEPFDTSTVPSARTTTEARRDAKKDGWVRRRRNGRFVDLCPACATPAP